MTRGHVGAGAPKVLVDVALAHRLTLVVAAPGWGKSFLLQQWAKSAPSITVATPPSGWTPFALARELLRGLALHGATVGAVDFPAHAAPDSPDNPAQVAALAAAVCAVAGRTITDRTLVLLDDVEATSSSLEQFLEALVLHLPTPLHLVIACRRQPGLRLARLRAAGDVADVSADQLAMRPGEMDEIGLDAAGTATVNELLEASGGWPLAVRLAAETVRRGGPVDRAAILDRLLAPDALLHAYLAEEVLGGLEPLGREILAIAAHVPYVSANFLHDLGRPELAAHLAELSTGGVFLEPEGTAPDRWRADLLGGEFVRRALPAPPIELLRRGVDALLEAHDLEHALALAARLGDPEAAMRVVLAVERPHRLAAPGALAGVLDLAGRSGDHPRIAELRGDLQFLSGDWDRALESFAKASAVGRSDATSPRLHRKQAVILYLRGRLDEAEAVAREARVDGTDPGEEAQLLAWQAAMRWMRNDIVGCEELVERAAANASASGDDAALATVHTTRAMLAALRGDRPGNVTAYQLALEHARRADDVVQVARIRSNIGSHHLEEGAYPEALVELEAAIEVAELTGSETFTALAYSNRGETYMRMGRLDDALRDLRHSQQIWERLGSHLVDYALGQLATTQLLRGQRTEARALFGQAVERAQRRDDAQSLAPALIGLARSLMDDDLEAAAATAQRAIDGGHALWQPQAEVVAGWIALRRGDRRAARAYAGDARQHAQHQLDHPTVAEVLLLEAAIEQPPSATLAAEAGRLWHDLGNPIGEARAAMLVAETCTGAIRETLLTKAEELLFEAGAWGYLEELRSIGREVPAVSITTLGGFRVARRGVAVEAGQWSSRKARDVVKLLVARRGAPVLREEAAELLWPDEPDRSSKRLSVLLSTIRTVLDPDKRFPPDHFVGADHDIVWLVREHLDIDVEHFLREVADGRRLIANGETEKGELLLAQAAARYLGPFCAEDPYADWSAGTRELARHTFVDVSRQLATLATARAAPGDAVLHHVRILDVDPYDESAHLDLVRALLDQRRHGEARRPYRTYCQRLAELDLDAASFPS